MTDEIFEKYLQKAISEINDLGDEIAGGVTYTLARSRDNASSIGGGGTNVAQDDQNLAAI